MNTPKTLPELRSALATILAGAINGDVKPEAGRVALTAATRIIESMQAETRARGLAHAVGLVVPETITFNVPMFTAPDQ